MSTTKARPKTNDTMQPMEGEQLAERLAALVVRTARRLGLVFPWPPALAGLPEKAMGWLTLFTLVPLLPQRVKESPEQLASWVAQATSVPLDGSELSKNALYFFRLGSDALASFSDAFAAEAQAGGLSERDSKWAASALTGVRRELGIDPPQPTSDEPDVDGGTGAEDQIIPEGRCSCGAAIGPQYVAADGLRTVYRTLRVLVLELDEEHAEDLRTFLISALAWREEAAAQGLCCGCYGVDVVPAEYGVMLRAIETAPAEITTVRQLGLQAAALAEALADVMTDGSALRLQLVVWAAARRAADGRDPLKEGSR